MQCNMKLIGIIFTILVTQVSASFFDVFQGAVLSVQNSFGKLLSDVVTDVKETVDCTILAVEHVFSLSDPANDHYYEKCKNGLAVENKPPIVVTPLPKLDNTVEVFKDTEYIKKNISEEIETKINETLSRMLSKYDVRDKIDNVQEILAKESDRLANVSSMVKQELDKLSSEVTSDLRKIEEKDDTPNVENVLEKINLLQERERAANNSSEALEIHKVVNKVLDQLDVIEATEASENIKLEEILKDLETNSNDSFVQLDKKFEVWKEEKANYLEEIKNRMEVENEINRHVLTEGLTNHVSTEHKNISEDFRKSNNNSLTDLSTSQTTRAAKQADRITSASYSSAIVESSTILMTSESPDTQNDRLFSTISSNVSSTNNGSINLTMSESFPNITTSNISRIPLKLEPLKNVIPTLQSTNESLTSTNSTTESSKVSILSDSDVKPSLIITPTSFFNSASPEASVDSSTSPPISEHPTILLKSESSANQTIVKSFSVSSLPQLNTTTFTTKPTPFALSSSAIPPSQQYFVSTIPESSSSKAVSGYSTILSDSFLTPEPLRSLFKSSASPPIKSSTAIISKLQFPLASESSTNSIPILTNITDQIVATDTNIHFNQSVATESPKESLIDSNSYRPTLQKEYVVRTSINQDGNKTIAQDYIFQTNTTDNPRAPLVKWSENLHNRSLVKFVELNDHPLVHEDLDPVPVESVRASNTSVSSSVSGESIVFTTNKPLITSTQNTKHIEQKLSADYEAFLKKVTNSANHKKGVQEAKRLIEDSKKTDLIIHHILKNRKSARSVFNNYESTNFR